ncbi:PREDICTED: uncharacterized protein LOC106147261 [Chinchilla lanigera]|uniref:uncharacterized protein LOC106147261 n=1 Tax=Chinchilla lanigera TaxID=34839 RepID=UPI000695CBD6|nr:PREDICTED: uncharacterized protein LOC106147261 [Chinchilla lanigera]
MLAKRRHKPRPLFSLLPSPGKSRRSGSNKGTPSSTPSSWSYQAQKNFLMYCRLQEHQGACFQELGAVLLGSPGAMHCRKTTKDKVLHSTLPTAKKSSISTTSSKHREIIMCRAASLLCGLSGESMLKRRLTASSLTITKTKQSGTCFFLTTVTTEKGQASSTPGMWVEVPCQKSGGCGPQARCPAEVGRCCPDGALEHAEDYAFLSLRPDLSAAWTNCASDALSNYLLAPTPRPLLLRLALQPRAGLHWSLPTSLIALAPTII